MQKLRGSKTMEKRILLYNLSVDEAHIIKDVLEKSEYTIVNQIEGDTWENDYQRVDVYDTFEAAARNSDLVLMGYDKRKVENKQFLQHVDYLEKHGIANIKSNSAQKHINLLKGIQKTRVSDNLKIPVILILGMGYETQVASVESYLCRQFEKYDYSVLHIASEEYFKLAGGVTLPEFLYSDTSRMTREKKLMEWMEKQIEESGCDVVITGLPEETFDIISDHMVEDEILSIFSDAVCFDYIILCAYNAMYDAERMTFLYDILKYKYDIEVDAMGISDKRPIILDGMRNAVGYIKIERIESLAENQFFIPKIEKSTLFSNIIAELREEIEEI